MDHEFDERARKDAPTGARPSLPNWGPPPSRPTSVGPAVLPPPPLPRPRRPPGPVTGSTAQTGPVGSQQTGWVASGPTGRPLGAGSELTATDMVGALAAALLFTLGLLGHPGSVVTLAATCCMATAIWRRPGRRRITVAVGLASALGAALLLVVRASPWVATPALCLLSVGLVVASQDWLRAGSAVPTVMAGFVGDAVEATRRLGRPIAKLLHGRSPQRPVLRGGALAAAILVPLAWLLVSADPIFGEVLTAGVVGRTAWTHLLVTVALAPLTVALVLGTGPNPGPYHRPSKLSKPGSMVEATIVLSAVIMLLGAWGATQLVVALGGAEHLLEAVDLTAAQHARRGFFQLVAVAAILLVLVVGADRVVERRTVGDRFRFLAMTAVLGLETLGLAFASYRRLALYVDGFGHTMLRTAVAWFLAWLVVVMAVVIVGMNRPAARSFRVGPALFVLGDDLGAGLRGVEPGGVGGRRQPRPAGGDRARRRLPGPRPRGRCGADHRRTAAEPGSLDRQPAVGPVVPGSRQRPHRPAHRLEPGTRRGPSGHRTTRLRATGCRGMR